MKCGFKGPIEHAKEGGTRLTHQGDQGACELYRLLGLVKVVEGP